MASAWFLVYDQYTIICTFQAMESAMYIDAQNRVDRKNLRKYVFEQLSSLKQAAQKLCGDKKSFWEQTDKLARKNLFGKDLDKTITALQQLNYLPNYIQLWIETAVDSPERFDFFVLTKAHEIKSGDEKGDYFWAMQIRHDQLMGLVKVLQVLLKEIKDWITKTPEELLNNSVFLGLTEVGIEKQVHMEAEKIYKERQK